MSICKQTYYNNGSYLRARSNEKAICELITAIENGTVIPSIVNGGTFKDSIIINGDLVVNGSISYQTISIDSITVPSISTNTITLCDNYIISCGESGLNINTTINVSGITADTGTITTLNSTTINVVDVNCVNINDASNITVDTLYVNNTIDTLRVNVLECSYNTVEFLTADTANIEDLIVTNAVDTLGITTLDSSNATISDISSTNIDVTGTMSINGFPLNKIYTGTINVNGSSGPFTITFPTAYTSTPLVFLTSFGALRQYYVHYITNTTATISEGAGSGIATSIYWMSTESNS